jgi:hypothetical protein
MFMTLARIGSLAVLLSACAHHGAIRVQCEGPLRPINLSSGEVTAETPGKSGEVKSVDPRDQETPR